MDAGFPGIKNDVSDIEYSPYRFVIEAMLFLTYIAFGITWASAGIFLPEMMRELSLSLSNASFINTSVTIAKIFAPTFAGFVAVKMGYRKAFLLSAFLIAASVFTPLFPSYLHILSLRFMMGVGGALMAVYFAPIVMEWFPRGEWVLANGLNAISLSIGMMLGLAITSPLMLYMGGDWKKVLLLYGSLNLLMAILWAFMGRDRDGVAVEKREKTSDSFFIALKNKELWKMIFAYSGMLSFYMVMVTYFPTFYRKEMGFGTDSPVHLAPALFMLSSIPATFAGTVISGRSGKRIPILRWSGLLILPALAGMIAFRNPAIILSASLLAGFFMFLWRPAFFTIPQELPGSTPARVSQMMGIFWTVSYSFTTFNVWLVGIMTECRGSFLIGFIYAGIVSCSMLLWSFAIRETGPSNH